MTHEHHNLPTPVDKDVLISRIVDGIASESDWASFETLCSQDASLWQDLAASQRFNQELLITVESQLSVADDIQLPMDPHVLPTHRLKMALSWSGWAIAAALTLTWALGLSTGLNNTKGNTAGLVPTISTPDEAFDRYLSLGQSSGTVINEVPTKVLLHSTRLPGESGFQVIYIRQIVERAIVSDINLYRMDQDETGRPVPIRITPRIQPVSNTQSDSIYNADPI